MVFVNNQAHRKNGGEKLFQIASFQTARLQRWSRKNKIRFSHAQNNQSRKSSPYWRKVTLPIKGVTKAKRENRPGWEEGGKT